MNIDIYKIIGYIFALLPMILRYVVNFHKLEVYIGNTKKALLDQVRMFISISVSNEFNYNNEIVELNGDFKSRLQDKISNYLYSNTSQVLDLTKITRRAKRAIWWIRCLKYVLFSSSSLTIITFIIFHFFFSDEIKLEIWIYIIIALFVLIFITWLIKEIFFDRFNKLCEIYEIERN